jgi:4-amino-4-deoxy-L-arabinose transferase-like glycosyltransferase
MPFLSLTTDEPIHYRYGERILASDAGRFDDSVMPISALNALPAYLGRQLPESRLGRALRHFQVARLPTLLSAIVLGFTVFAWSRRLYGPAGGLLSLFLLVFEPNLLAHARLITQDVFLATAMVACLYLFWRFLRRRTLGWAFAAALTFGIAQTTKYTAVSLFPILAVIAALYDGPRMIPLVRRGRWIRVAKYLGKTVLWTLLILAVAVAVVNAAFLREYTFKPLHEYRFQSSVFSTLQRWGDGADWIRVPLPSPYILGLDAVMAKERSGQGHGNIYLLGELRHPDGFLGYFLAAYALKTPLATQLIFLTGLYLLLRRWRWARVLRHEQALLVPLLILFLYFNFLYRAQLGLRFVLMAYPLMAVLSGRVGAAVQEASRLPRVALGLGLVSVVISTLSYFPDYLAYFNELVWDRRTAYRYLADSNLDWGQSEGALRAYMAAHPSAVLEPSVLGEGEVIVRVNNLVGITENPGRYAYLREACFPAATIGHAYLLYRLPCDEPVSSP